MDEGQRAPLGSETRRNGAAPARAIVIGGGVGGLTTVIALRQIGIDAVAFERRSDVGRIRAGGGLHLWNNAMLALRQLGVAERMEAAGAHLERTVFCSARGATIADWPVDEPARRTGVPSVAVSRPDLLQVLMTFLDEGALLLGKECIGFEQDAEGVVARFADGTEEHGDLLIGADGINSVVRAQLFGRTRPRYAGYAIWQSTVAFAHPATPPGTFRLFIGRGTRFGFYPVGRDRVSWFATINTTAGGHDPASGARESLLAHLHGFPEPTTSLIAATEEAAILRTDNSDRDPSPVWGEGRVTLLGDAAHAITLNVGQGACQAIEDAVALMKCLAPGREVPGALADYAASRRNRTATMVRKARLLGVVLQLENPLACALRDQLLKPVLRTVAWKDHQQQVAYVV